MSWDILFLILNLSFWWSLGITEGFKWTHDPHLVTAKSYHVFRGITNASFLAAMVASAFVFTGLSMPLILFKLFCATCFAWPVYELVLNYVNHGRFLYQKDAFVLGSFTLKHPPVQLMPVLSLLGLIGYFVFIFL